MQELNQHLGSCSPSCNHGSSKGRRQAALRCCSLCSSALKVDRVRQELGNMQNRNQKEEEEEKYVNPFRKMKFCLVCPDCRGQWAVISVSSGSRGVTLKAAIHSVKPESQFFLQTGRSQKTKASPFPVEIPRSAYISSWSSVSSTTGRRCLCCCFCCCVLK